MTTVASRSIRLSTFLWRLLHSRWFWLNGFPVLCGDNIQLYSQGAFPAHHQVCWPSVKQNLQLPVASQGWFRTPEVYTIPCVCDQVYIWQTGCLIDIGAKKNHGQISHGRAQHKFRTPHQVLGNQHPLYHISKVNETQLYPSNMNWEDGFSLSNYGNFSSFPQRKAGHHPCRFLLMWFSRQFGPMHTSLFTVWTPSFQFS